MKRELVKEKRHRIKTIAARLTQAFPEIHSPLHHRNPYELLVATILSAQSTDEQVNRVTPDFFSIYPEPDSLAKASVPEIGSSIHSIGLFRSKARTLKKCARQLLEYYGGEVPAPMEGLTRLAGVGRKTANVVLGQAFGIPGVVVDTHVMRLSRRLGLTKQTEPSKIEKELMAHLPKEQWSPFSHRLILHGRKVCYARKPRCEICTLNNPYPSAEL